MDDEGTIFFDRPFLPIVHFDRSIQNLTREYENMGSENMYIFLETSRDQFTKISFKTLRDCVCEKLVEVHKLVLKVAV